MISTESLAGYVLEELLARELRDSGFRLLLRRADDPHVLREQGNGLAILGRGGLHQADVLGELLVRPRFMHPIRLFMEAKHRPGTKVGIETVRNAVGVLSDIREHYTRDHARQRHQRYSYRYAIFSTGGFANSAVDYATTHDISSIDLSHRDWHSFTSRATDIAEEAINVANRVGLAKFPVNALRQVLRSALLGGGEASVKVQLAAFAKGDWAAVKDLSILIDDLNVDWPGQVRLVAAQTSLFTLTQVSDGQDLQRLRGVKASLLYEKRPGRGAWLLSPPRQSGKPLSLALPPRLEEEFLGKSNNERRQGQAPRLELLTDGPEVVEVEIEEAPQGDSTQATWNKLRDEFAVDPVGGTLWTEVAARNFMFRLSLMHPDIQAMISLAAGRAERGGFGSITRAEVYERMRYDDDRTLRGFTRPVRTLVLQMVDEGEVPADVEWPLYAWYETGKRATEFRVPADFVAALS